MSDTENRPTVPGINRQFHAQTYSLPLDRAQKESGQSLSNVWPSWYHGFKRYAVTTGLFLKDNNVQVNNLTNAMGSCADDILTTLRIDEDTIQYKTLIGKVETFFKVRRNVLAERQKFNKRVQGRQEDGRTVQESVEEFINSLYTLAETCEYGELKDELIRDRIIAGVKDERLSDQLVQQDDLKLEKAVEMARKWEAREADLKTIRGETAQQIDFVGKRKPQKKYAKLNERDSGNSEKCWFCGGARHKRSNCPACNAKCQKCSKIGHYAVVCHGGRWKKVEEVESDESGEDLEEEVVFHMGQIHSNNERWEAEIVTNANPTLWKLDTGAETCVISDSTPWLKNQTIHKTKHKLRGAGGIDLHVLGIFKATLKYKENQVQKDVYVVKNQKNSLLSKSACVELGLIKLAVDSEVHEIGPDSDFKVKYPALFQGLGKMKSEPYKITLKKDCQPHCLYTPRNIAHPLIPRVKKEIESMLEQDVIMEVTAPTDWCSGIVPVPK